jgi:large subunit ribosomal protein L23
MNKYEIIKRPIVTERSTQLRELGNKVTFEVDRGANKIAIKKAIEEIFSVKVTDVRTMNVHGKWKRVGRNIGRRSDWKKAIVTLAEGERIELLDGGA